MLSTDVRSGDGLPTTGGTWSNVPVPALPRGLETIRDRDVQDVLTPLNAQPSSAR